MLTHRTNGRSSHSLCQSPFSSVLESVSASRIQVGSQLFPVGSRPTLVILAIPAEWNVPLKRSVYAFTVFYNPSLMATKTAILLLYIRMAAAHRFLRFASYITMAIVNVAGIVLSFLFVFECRPVSAAFSEANGSCINLVTLYLSSAPINVLTDLAILPLSLPILTGLRVEWGRRSSW